MRALGPWILTLTSIGSALGCSSLGDSAAGEATAKLATSANEAQSPVARLGWLAGHWRVYRDPAGAGTPGAGTPDRGFDEELWLPPRGGSMFGISRSIAGDGALKMFEFARIEARGDACVFIAQPRGRAGAEFPMRECSDRHVVFENPEHDFPTRIEYRRTGPQSIRAQIFGDEPGPSWSYRWIGPVQ